MEVEYEIGPKGKPLTPQIHLFRSVVAGTLTFMCLSVLLFYENISTGDMIFMSFLTAACIVPMIVQAVIAAIKLDRVEQENQAAKR